MSTQECFQLRDTGSCQYGANCRFIHPSEETRGSRRRTEQICHAFRDTGSCQYGDNCRFSHNPALKDKPAPATSNEARPPRVRKPREHKEPSTGGAQKPANAGRLECYNFKSTGSCQFGDNCRFLHGDAQTRGSLQRNAQVCFSFRDSGRCEFGNDCRFSHDLNANGSAATASAGGAGARGGRRPRKEHAAGGKPKPVCRDFAANGNCKFGDECRFSHETTVDQE